MNKSPAFQFYVKDFLTDDKVAVMNMEARGTYITLLCFCWNNNGLTNDQEELKEMCGNPANWEKIWKKVSRCFYENSSKLFNKRLDKEREKQEYWKQKSKEGGIKSGKSRQKKVKLKGGLNKTKGGSCLVEPKGNHSVSSSSSSIPSSLNNKEDIYTIIKHWNSQKIKILEDRETNIRKKTFSKIQKQLKDYSLKEINKAITNYSIILKGDKYFFSYSWQLWEFLDRGLVNFLTKNEPFKNYLSDKNKGSTIEEQRKKKLEEWVNKPLK